MIAYVIGLRLQYRFPHRTGAAARDRIQIDLFRCEDRQHQQRDNHSDASRLYKTARLRLPALTGTWTSNARFLSEAPRRVSLPGARNFDPGRFR
jgi:hypothetical protein